MYYIKKFPRCTCVADFFLYNRRHKARFYTRNRKEYKGKGAGVQYVLVNSKDKSRGADVFDYTKAKIYSDQGKTLGFVLEENLYLLDLDATVPQGKFVADYIIKKYPDIICFKTPKAGGYHFFFKSPVPVKCGVGYTTIFGFPIDLRKARGHAILPDNYAGRAYVNGCKDLESFETVMNDYNVFLTPTELRDLIPYGKDVKNPVDLTALQQGERNETIFRWLARWSRFRGATQLEDYGRVISEITGFSYKEISNSIKSINKYIEEDNEPIEEEEIEGLIVGKDLFDLAINVLDYIKRSGVIKYDICTGNYMCSLRLAHEESLSQVDMYNYFRLYFKDKVRYWYKDGEGKTSLKPISELDLKNIFELITKHCTINSRASIYESIPKWDGIPRIATFMKVYMDCDAKPEFFLLLMTALVGKLKEPDKCYVPFFFDVCGNKGVGKSLLFRRLMGERFVTTIVPSQREDDVCTNIYSKGALIALDDECLLTQGRGFSVWSEDKLKAFVTQAEDVFARKFQNVEYHPRGFVLCRTSNFVKSATDADERRQIIFESNLPARECRIRPEQLSDKYFEQMRAEAKDYYEKYGLYKMTRSDWDAVEVQQSDYTDDENIFISEIKEYLANVFNNIKLNNGKYYAKLSYGANEIVVTWELYRKWVTDKNTLAKPMSGLLFWKNIRSIAQKTGIIKPLMGRKKVEGYSQVQVAVVYPDMYDIMTKGTVDNEQQTAEEIPDMEY